MEIRYPLELTQKRRKNICTSRSFGVGTTELLKLKEAVGSYANNCATKLRYQKSCCTNVSVFLSTNPFKPQAKQYHPYRVFNLDVPTNDSIEIVKTALIALESIFKNGYRYQKAGVLLSGLSEATNNKNLFSSEKDEKINSLMKSIDNTNYRYGRSTLSLASAGVHKRWNMKREYSSKIDTADFHCLPTIKT